MKKTHLIQKALAVLLLTAFTACALASCGGSPREKSVVGTINGDNVYYDEVYAHTLKYLDYVKSLCGDDTEKAYDMLEDYVISDILEYHGKTLFCESLGLTDSIFSDNEIDTAIASTYNISPDDEMYSEYLDAFGLSDRYLRYTITAELLYTRVYEKYIESNRLLSDDDDVIKYIKNNFIHVNHLAIFNDAGDNFEGNYKRICLGAEMLKNGEATINYLIGKNYSEDFGDISGNGYYFAKGSMAKEYEKAAFSLDINEVSDIITVNTERNGVMTEGYYVIQRLPMDDAYIDENYSKLETEYYYSIISPDLEEFISTLEFTPNSNYEKLDLMSLDKPKKSVSIGVIIAISVVAVAIAAIIVIVIILKKKHKSKNISSASKQKNSLRRK